MAELKPCPFCGGEAHTYRTMAQRYCAICNKPFCANVGPFDTEAEAIAAWNTRAYYEAETDSLPMTDGNMARYGWVRVVRCRDCVEYHPELYSHIACEMLGRYVDPDGYCAWGERREP